MIKRCAVIGLGRFGTEVVRWLESHNIPVLAIDSDKDVVQKVADEENVTGALCMDCTDESALLEADITSMEVVVVAIGDHHVENSIHPWPHVSCPQFPGSGNSLASSQRDTGSRSPPRLLFLQTPASRCLAVAVPLPTLPPFSVPLCWSSNPLRSCPRPFPKMPFPPS